MEYAAQNRWWEQEASYHFGLKNTTQEVGNMDTVTEM